MSESEKKTLVDEKNLKQVSGGEGDIPSFSFGDKGDPSAPPSDKGDNEGAANNIMW